VSAVFDTMELSRDPGPPGAGHLRPGRIRPRPLDDDPWIHDQDVWFPSSDPASTGQWAPTTSMSTAGCWACRIPTSMLFEPTGPSRARRSPSSSSRRLSAAGLARRSRSWWRAFGPNPKPVAGHGREADVDLSASRMLTWGAGSTRLRIHGPHAAACSDSARSSSWSRAVAARPARRSKVQETLGICANRDRPNED